MNYKVLWTKEEVSNQIMINIGDAYSAAIVASALYLKLYGEIPMLGLTGHQASAAELIASKLPDSSVPVFFNYTEFDFEKMVSDFKDKKAV